MCFDLVIGKNQDLTSVKGAVVKHQPHNMKCQDESRTGTTTESFRLPNQEYESLTTILIYSSTDWAPFITIGGGEAGAIAIEPAI